MGRDEIEIRYIMTASIQHISILRETSSTVKVYPNTVSLKTNLIFQEQMSIATTYHR